MSDIKVKCQRCGSNIYHDEEDDCLRCQSCARAVDKDGKPLPPKEAPPLDRYRREYHIPRSLRRKDDNGSLHR